MGFDPCKTWEIYGVNVLSDAHYIKIFRAQILSYQSLYSEKMFGGGNSK